MIVEFSRERAGKFEMLELVVADRHDGRVIQNDVCRHEHGIIEKSHVDVGFLLGGLVLELGHPFHLADRRDGVQYPRKFAVCGDPRLLVDDGFFGIKAGGKVYGEKIGDVLRELFWILWFGDRMEVGDEEKAMIIDGVLKVHEIAERPEIIAEMELPAWLDARDKYRFHIKKYITENKNRRCRTTVFIKG